MKILRRYFEHDKVETTEKLNPNENEKKTAEEVLEAISTSNLVGLYYIKNYIITDSIMKKYESYRRDYPSENHGSQDDILNFITIKVKSIKVQ